MYTVKVTIQGTKPLLMHRMAMPGETVPEGVIPKGATKEEKQYLTDFYLGKYQTEDGKLYQPALHIQRAMEIAAKDHRVVGKGKKTYESLIANGVRVEPDFIIHSNQNCVMDLRQVRVGRARIIRCRPRLDDWSLSFTFVVENDQIPLEILNKILIDAGKVGIGDYRKYFGKFMVTHFSLE